MVADDDVGALSGDGSVQAVAMNKTKGSNSAFLRLVVCMAFSLLMGLVGSVVVYS